MIFGIFQRKRMNNQTIKSDSDKIKRRISRTAKKMVRSGMLPDSHSLASFLITVDGEYAHLHADINNLTRVKDYDKIRAEKYAQTERMLTFYGTQYHELQNLNKIVASKAEATGQSSELSGEKLDAINISTLQKKFQSLSRSENDWSNTPRSLLAEKKTPKSVKPSIDSITPNKVRQKTVESREEN